jgi:hypothetical protein
VRAQAQISSGVVEGLNNKAKVTMRRSYGFRTFRILELALYHSLGKLPEPELAHEFFERFKIMGKGCARAQSRIFCDLFCRVDGDCLRAEFVKDGG